MEKSDVHRSHVVRVMMEPTTDAMILLKRGTRLGLAYEPPVINKMRAFTDIDNLLKTRFGKNWRDINLQM